MDAARIEAGQKALTRMLITLEAGGYILLDPPPPRPEEAKTGGPPLAPSVPKEEKLGSFGSLLLQARSGSKPVSSSPRPEGAAFPGEPVREAYQPVHAHPTPELDTLLAFRSVNPLYGAFLLKHLGIADRDERIQALESVLEVPTSILRDVRVPRMR